MKDYKEKRPEGIYKTMEDGYFHTWVTLIKINYNQMTIEFDQKMSESVYISGTKVDSVCAFKPGSLLLSVLSKNVILLVKNWQVIHETVINGKFAVSETLLLPGFNIENYPIVIDLSKRSYDVVNVLTGARNMLIRASALNDVRQQPVIISAPDEGRISIDFAVAQLNEHSG